MLHLEGQTRLERLLRDLHHAAGIAGDHDTRSRLADSLDLAPPELRGDLGLEEIVDTRAAAAKVAVGQLHERQPGNAPQELSRLRAHLLAVSEVAGVVVGDSLPQLAQGQLRVDEDL